MNETNQIWMATADEIPSINQLEMELKVNNVIMQHGNTNKMIFNVDYIIWYLSQFMVLEPGDVISTGTPPRGRNGEKSAIIFRTWRCG